MDRNLRWTAVAAALAAALTVAGCSDDDNSNNTPRYSKLVSFGDSLSDVGTHRVGAIAAAGGGEYSINPAGGAGGVNWTERLAARLGVAAPCAAQTGLMSELSAVGILPVAVTNVAGCYNYAQGGARVTNPVGSDNAALPGNQIGQLTKPVVEQINRHLAASGGAFKGDELVTVSAGGNDVFLNLAAVGAGAATPAQAVTAMATAGAELGGYVKSLIVGKGATRVVVGNLPDITQTPGALAADAGTRELIRQMVETFNGQLAAALPAGTAGVLLVDAYTRGRDQTARPALYQLTNVTTPACDPAKTAFASVIPPGSMPSISIVCTPSTLLAGDTSHYLYADTVHPTPYANQLFADYVAERLAAQGWL